MNEKKSWVGGRKERVPYGTASNWQFKPPGCVQASKCQVNFKKSGLVKIFKEHKDFSQRTLVLRIIKRSASYKTWPISKRNYFFLIVLIFPILKSPLTKEICLLNMKISYICLTAPTVKIKRMTDSVGRDP